MDDHHFIQRMRTLIGSHFDYQGHEWVLIEVLEEEAQLVLSDPKRHATIQANLYGQAARRGPRIRLIPLFGETTDSLSTELLELLATKIHPASP